jgi:hypothetical protein
MKPLRQLIVLVIVMSFLTSHVQASKVPDGAGGNPAGGISPEDINFWAGIAGGIGGLLNDFSWNKIPGFACKTATAVNGRENTGTSGGAQKTLCGLAATYDSAKKLTDNYDKTLHTWGKNLFLDFATKDLGLGSYLTREQLAGFTTRVEAALNDREDPLKIVTEFSKIAKEKTAMENANYASAPEGTLENTYYNIMQQSPVLKMQQGLSQLEKEQIAITQGQSMTNVMQSGRIAEEQNASQFQEDHNDAVQQIAPAILDEATSAVSTRATVQEVVTAITIYMQQDAQQFAYLSEQLAIQTQQQVYVTNELHLLTQSMMEERLNEIQARQYALKNALNTNVKKYETAADRMITVGKSFVNASTTTDLDLGLFRYK